MTTSLVCVDAIAPVRSRPDPQSERLTDLLFGQAFVAKCEHEGLVFGATAADRVQGFVARAALAERAEAPTHRVRRTIIHVYRAPDLRMAAGMVLPMNALLELTGRSALLRYDGPESAVVELRSGGWVSEPAVAAVGDFEKDPQAVAASFIGTVYLHGGTTWLGCDGPGLVQTVLASCGLGIPRRASEQVRFLAGKTEETDLGEASSSSGSVIYLGDSCGLVFDGRVIAARTESMQVDVTPVDELCRSGAGKAPARVFALPSAMRDGRQAQHGQPIA